MPGSSSFDHADSVARGGQATLDRIRLPCRAHNQYEAERVSGVPFMNHKRKEAQRVAAARHTGAAARDAVAEDEVIPWLRSLGFRPDEARRAAWQCAGMKSASLEESVRFALRSLAPPHRRTVMG